MFKWTDEQEKAFTPLKDSLVSDQVMTCFDPSLQSETWVDASPVFLYNKSESYLMVVVRPVQQNSVTVKQSARLCPVCLFVNIIICIFL